MTATTLQVETARTLAVAADAACVTAARAAVDRPTTIDGYSARMLLTSARRHRDLCESYADAVEGGTWTTGAEAGLAAVRAEYAATLFLCGRVGAA